MDQTPKVWDGKTWAAKPPLYWDGAEWMSSAPTPREFPAFVSSTKGSYSKKDVAELALPADTRANDFVVSVCAQQSGEPRVPRLIEPTGVVPAVFTFPSGQRLHVSAWPWDPSRGAKTRWDVTGSPNTELMNLTYRYGNIRSTGSPVSGITEHHGVNKVPLMPAQRFTSLYIVLAASDTLTGFAWPLGFNPRSQHLGAFGQEQVSLITADTPGGSGSPGDLALDTTVKDAVVFLVTIPGRSDGNPTWILGDASNSTLGKTTFAG
ncbi:hypothetical protein [Streptomyces noursei]|uniref:hypothetical protein n=1 Tax=Streptomyces noursei TaxID=1971 RepID=UPI001676B13D|nr:hypothetical protein [Streptomyces noursei]